KKTPQKSLRSDLRLIEENSRKRTLGPNNDSQNDSSNRPMSHCFGRCSVFERAVRNLPR
ncbi:hypothetical protein HAX54_010486, partial [Datura stramonium]|nr:hypothetical protein [Datura stramonium]